MNTASLSEWRISYSGHKPACILDSELACSIYGLPVAKQLGSWLELWIVRDLWHLLEPGPRKRLPSSQPELTQRTLREWERLRQHIEPRQRPVHVLADALGESSLPPGCDPDLLWRWEQLARGLDERSPTQLGATRETDIAVRDLLALAAARSAVILTLRSTDDRHGQPSLCKELESRGIPCTHVPVLDPLSQCEAMTLRGLFVHANLSSLLWAGMDLCILHLFVPMAATLSPTQAWDDYPTTFEEDGEDQPFDLDVIWGGAQAFWYALYDPAHP